MIFENVPRARSREPPQCSCGIHPTVELYVDVAP